MAAPFTSGWGIVAWSIAEETLAVFAASVEIDAEDSPRTRLHASHDEAAFYSVRGIAWMCCSTVSETVGLVCRCVA
jgi:hypothetical protein